MTVLLLASASPARLAVLRTAGLDPRVTVSGVDEDALLAGLRHTGPEQQIRSLAEAKADAVARRVAAGGVPDVETEDGPPDDTDDGHQDDTDDVIVIGCDSMLLIDGELQGKPDSAEQAKQRWRQMAGRDGVLITGHAVRRVSDGSIAAAVSGTRSTTVRMGRPSDADLDAYIATGEPLAVAGALTIDGFGGWFVEGVDGDPSNVLGISLPLTRELLQQVGVRVTDLWQVPAPVGTAPPASPAPLGASGNRANHNRANDNRASDNRASDNDTTSNGTATVDTAGRATAFDSPSHRST